MAQYLHVALAGEVGKTCKAAESRLSMKLSKCLRMILLGTSVRKNRKGFLKDSFKNKDSFRCCLSRQADIPNERLLLTEAMVKLYSASLNSQATCLQYSRKHLQELENIFGAVALFSRPDLKATGYVLEAFFPRGWVQRNPHLGYESQPIIPIPNKSPFRPSQSFAIEWTY